MLFDRDGGSLTLGARSGHTFDFDHPCNDCIVRGILFGVDFPTRFRTRATYRTTIALRPRIHGHLRRVSHVIVAARRSTVHVVSGINPLTGTTSHSRYLRCVATIPLTFNGLITRRCRSTFRTTRPVVSILHRGVRVIRRPHFAHRCLRPSGHSVTGTVRIFFGSNSDASGIIIRCPVNRHHHHTRKVPLLRSGFGTGLTAQFAKRHDTRVFTLYGSRTGLRTAPIGHFISLFIV